MFDGLYYRVRMGSGNKEQGDKSCIYRLSYVTVLFHRLVYFILQTVPVFIPYAQINLLLGEGKTDQKSRTATAQWEFHQSYARRNKPRSGLCVH